MISEQCDTKYLATRHMAMFHDVDMLFINTTIVFKQKFTFYNGQSLCCVSLESLLSTTNVCLCKLTQIVCFETLIFCVESFK